MTSFDLYGHNSSVIEMMDRAERLENARDSGEQYYGGEPIDNIIHQLYKMAEGHCKTVINSNVDESSKTWFIIKLNYIERKLTEK